MSLSIHSVFSLCNKHFHGFEIHPLNWAQMLSIKKKVEFMYVKV